MPPRELPNIREASVALGGCDRLEENGKRWIGWKMRMRQALKAGGVWDHIEVTGNPNAVPTAPVVANQPEDFAVWESGEARATSFISSKLSDALVEQVESLSPYRTWQYLCSRFDLAREASTRAILSALKAIKASVGNDVSRLIEEHEVVLGRARADNFILARPLPANATAEQTADTLALNTIYSDHIFEGLPNSTEWKAWAQVYRQRDDASMVPADVLKAIRDKYNRQRTAGVISASTSATNVVLGGNGKVTSSALVTSSSSRSGRTGGSSNSSSSQCNRPTCKFCKKDKPNHDLEKCWQNPANPKNHIKSSETGSGEKGSGTGKSGGRGGGRSEKSGTEKVDFAAATIAAASIELVDDDYMAPSEFNLDSCASAHIVADRSRFTDYRLSTRIISTAQGPVLRAVGVGNVTIQVRTNDEEYTIVLKDALHVPTSQFNPISVGRFLAAGCKLVGDSSYRIVSPTGKVIMEGVKGAQGIPQVSVVDPIDLVLASTEDERYKACAFAHRLFAHPGKAHMRDLLRLGVVRGSTTTDIDRFYDRSCPACRIAKTTRLPFPLSEHRATKPLERIHSDCAGPFRYTSFGGATMFIIVVDEASGWIDGEPLISKADVPEKFKLIVRRMRSRLKKNHLGVSQSTVLMSDNGSEYTSAAFKDVLKELRIDHQYWVPYTPQQNGRSERWVRTVKERITVLLAKGNLSRAYWAETFFFALFVLNNLPYTPNRGETPHFFLFNSHSPFFTSAKPLIFGRTVWIHDPDAGTFEDKAVEGIFLGVSEGRGRKAYRVKEKDAPARNLRWVASVHIAKDDAVLRARTVLDEDFIWEDEDEEDEKAEEEATEKELRKTHVSTERKIPAAGGEPFFPFGRPRDLQAPKASTTRPGPGHPYAPRPSSRNRPRIGDDEPVPFERMSQRARAEATGQPRRSSCTRRGDDEDIVGLALATVVSEPTDEHPVAIFSNSPSPAAVEPPVEEESALATKKTIKVGNRPFPTFPSLSSEALSSLYGAEWKEGFAEE
ncbi:hypothetical protein JCM10213_001317 [Rhodosporidiobolus nylandii]